MNANIEINVLSRLMIQQQTISRLNEIIYNIVRLKGAIQ